MGAYTDFNINATRGRHSDVFPCVVIGEAYTPSPEVKLTDSIWPFLGSCALHVLLFALVAHPAFNYPLSIGTSPPVLWLSLVSVPVNSEEADSFLPGPSVAFAVQREEPVRDSGRKLLAGADGSGPVAHQEVVAEPPAHASSEAIVAMPLPEQKTTQVDTSNKHPPEIPRIHASLPAAAPMRGPLRAVPVPQAAEPESPRAIAVTAENRLSGSEKLLQDNDAHLSQQIIGQNQQTAEKSPREHELSSVRTPLTQEPAAAEKKDQGLLQRENELQKLKDLEEAIPRKEIKQVAGDREVRKVSSPEVHKTSAPPPQHKKIPATVAAQNTPAKPMTVSLPLIKGDLKLVVTGSVVPETAITFKDFAQSRRDRPFSRAEARRLVKIIPVTVTTRDNSREIVVPRVAPGVYTFTGMSANEPAHVTLSLKLYEGSSHTITRELGKFTVTGKKVLVKILMPDGILWDDNSAFSGNMEDSDGVTKFNTESGLMWKEYAE